MRTKEKISITVDKEVVALIDEEIEAQIWENRSHAIENFCLEHYDLSTRKDRIYELVMKLTDFLERHPQHREMFRAAIQSETSKKEGGARASV